MNTLLILYTSIMMLNPYFVHLTNNVSKNAFVCSQNDFSYAVDKWSNLLGYMVYKVPSYKERAVLVENLYDEHGNGNLNNSHVHTIQRFMDSFSESCTQADASSKNSTNTSVVFINELDQMVQTKPWQFSIAALGTIEYEYVSISNAINEYSKKYVHEIHHYKCHEKLDVHHAEELFSLVDTNHSDVMDGITFGHNVFYKLYEQLCNNYF